MCVCVCIREAVKAEPGAHAEGRTWGKRKADAPGPEPSPVGRVTGAQEPAVERGGTPMKAGSPQFVLEWTVPKKGKSKAKEKLGGVICIFPEEHAAVLESGATSQTCRDPRPPFSFSRIPEVAVRKTKPGF